LNVTTLKHNTLDLFFTNNKELISEVESIPGIGDHDDVAVISKLTTKQEEKSTT